MVFYLVFGLILQTPRGDNIAWLLTGLFAFYFTRGVMSAGAQSILSNSVLVSTQRFPRVLLPIAAVIEEGAGFLASLVPLFTIAAITGAGLPTRTALWLPAVIFFHVLFNLGITLLVALLIIPFRDINNLLPYVTRIWLYLSPVIFDIGARLEGSSLPEVAQKIIMANPMVAILGWYRHATIADPLEPYHVWGTIVWSVVLFVAGLIVFIRNEHRLVRYL
jgi:teichoic acid transport system permease protein